MAWNVENYSQTVPDQVRDIFFGYLPFGSDYVMYCESSTAQRTSYACLYRRIGSDVLSAVTCSRNNGGEWVLDSYDTTIEYTGLTVSKPYYSYSNIKGQGRYTVSPTGQNLCVLMLVVIASIAVLKLVFGGVKMCLRKSEPY